MIIMSIPDDLLKSRFYLNMNRITGLVKLIHSDIDSLSHWPRCKARPLGPTSSAQLSYSCTPPLRMFCARLVLLFCFQLPYMGLLSKTF